MAIQQFQPEVTQGGRRHALLATFIHPAEVSAILTQQPFTLEAPQPMAAAIQAAVGRAKALTTYRVAPVEPVPDQIAESIESLSSSASYIRDYRDQGAAGFGMVRLDSLITPQPLADLEYVAELEASAPVQGNLQDVVQFVFPPGRVPEPAVIGNTVMFKTDAQSIFPSPIPRFRKTSDGYEVIADVRPRPNFLYVAIFPTLGGRQLVINGVHHVLALLKKGWKTAPAVIRQAASVEEIGLTQTTILASVSVPRPALVRDFLGASAVPLLRRPTAMAWRVALQSDQLVFPEG